ncbi:MarR family winged helix-turn-helix transcriptional regulator [Brevibacterium sp. UBA7493]|uniref:MarR family winged helix-turn-helix transcriptional regulator n=1 Tax=Brevibacterium sp. UBA7493 TaxID=1946121 RepID=UPI00257FB086|nr:MarR family winged helix-turn-helix transcriptional regulator [Brevibacterium sp. UBA7493]
MMMDRDRVRDGERVPHVSPVTEAPDEPRWLSEDQQVAWRSFLIAHQLLMSQLDKELRATHRIGMPEYEVLVHLSEQAGRCMRMALLADDMGMSRSRLTHIVSRMEKRGLVERTAIAEDGRGINCSLTDDGWTLLERSAPLHVEGVRQHLIDLLDDSEVETMRSIFLKVNSHMRDVP